jgi:enolase
VGDEGGFEPNVATADEALRFVLGAIEDTGYEPGIDITILP